MPRGGKRQGTPGRSYTNRADLNTPALAVTPPTYGDGAQQQRAQQVAPLPQTRPIQIQPFDRPSDRPGEPVTAGLPVGDGSSMPPEGFDPVLEGLRAAYRAAPNERIAELIEAIQNGQ